MKKYYLVVIVCLTASFAGFSQSQPTAIREKAKDPATIKMAAIADTMLIDKKAIVDDKKKAKKEKVHKECSRMKS